MTEELLSDLIGETELGDIPERYWEVVRIIGIRKFAEMSSYARGEEIYFPKVENVVAPARDRRIKREYNGRNAKELADRYNLTVKQIWNILKNEPTPGQISIEDWMGPDA